MNNTEVYYGLTGSSGIAIGPVWLYRCNHIRITKKNGCSIEKENARFDRAVNTAHEQLYKIEADTKKKLGEQEAQIFNVHQMFLSDPELLNKIRAIIENDQLNAEYAVEKGIDSFKQKLLSLDSDYFRDRIQDLEDISKRLQYNLLGMNPDNLCDPEKPSIILAEELTPSDTVSFSAESILGICTIKGGPTSHTAILARSLRIPALVSVPFNLETFHDTQMAILNADRGYIEINPQQDHITHATQVMRSQKKLWDDAMTRAQELAISSDQHHFEVGANIGNKKDAEQALKMGASGIGLFRTEFLYLDRNELPSQVEQVKTYQDIAEIIADKPIVVRTLDIGGDKEVAYLGIKNEANPFLGWRAIRMLDERPEIFQEQIETLLRAFVNIDLRIMLPMVSSIEEVIQAKEIITQTVDKLSKQCIEHNRKHQFGIMVEVPSAALLVEHISEYVDFFSIGTNDLTQYALAVDRTNERVANLASPFHPAVLRLIAMTIEEAHKKNKWVGMCGEMAGDPLATPLLMGLGLDEFSMAPASIPIIKQRIRSLDSSLCKKKIPEIMSLSSTKEIIDYLRIM